MTTSHNLINFAKEHLDDRGFVAVIQREPYVHYFSPKGIKVENAVGGAHILLDAVLKKIGGLMVAVGSGDADKEVVDEKNSIDVPPHRPKYALKRVFLKKNELQGFYYGFSNQTIWPLFHAVFVKPRFSNRWWKEYVKVNRKFAKAVIEEVKDKPDAFVWINDYHFALLPRLLKKQMPTLKIGVFWHIPWPTNEFLRICPWKNELLDGLLGADFFGFHRGYHTENFIECARRNLEVLVEQEPRSIIYKGHTTKIADVPVGVDFHEIEEEIKEKESPSRALLKEDFGIDAGDEMKIAIGVERIDYTKGLVERLRTIDKFLEKYSEYQKKFIYLSIGVPSRTQIPEYRSYNKKISNLVEKINAKYQTENWKPIHFIKRSIPREKIFQYYQLSDLCLVTSLDDGMNLVAKEYVICTNPSKGMLVLSKFAGAAKDLTQAILINPYDIEGTAAALNEALNMNAQEKEKRNEEMKDFLRENNIYKWGIDFIRHAAT